jgi:flagellar basal-body rod protein FlgF
VLGESGPIVFNVTDRDIVINPDGTIRVREGRNANSDAARGKLRLAAFANSQQLRKDGMSTFTTPAGMQPQAAAATVRVVQGTIEKSNVRPVVEMTRMIELSRSYAEVSNILQQHSEMRRGAIERLADVPV